TTAIIGGGTIETTGNQTYGGAVNLTADADLIGDAATFAESIAGGGQSLDLNFTNTTTLEGATNLASLASVGDITVRGLLETTGTQAYDGGLQLFGDASLVGNTGTFATGVTGAGNSLSLNFSEPTQINGNFTGIDNLTVVGQANVDGSIATTGNQTYQSAIYLIDNATLISGAGAITAAAVADGGEGNSLTVGDANQTGSVTLGGNLSFGSLSSGAGAFAVTLSGANNTLASVSLLNTGNLSIGTSAASRTFATNGFTAPAVATSFLAGTITTDSGVITLNATSLTANAVLDSAKSGASNGAAILLANGTLLNGFRLETFGGQSDTEVTGDTVVSDGELIVETGSLNLGTPSQPGTLTATQDWLIQVANGAFNVFNGSTIEAGNNALTIQTNALQVDSAAGNITAGSITLLPATSGTNIFLGIATGTGLEINQNAFNAFRTPLITIGEAGYNGTVDVGTLAVPEGRLDIIANGSGGTVLFEGNFTSTATGMPGGIGLFVEGSGATTTINGTITSAGAVVINDAIVTDGNHTIDTSATNANITITGGTAGIYGAANQTNSLTINAGNGTVILGNQTGFGDNSGAAALLEDVTISAGSTLLGSVPSEINGTFSVLTGDIAVSGNLTAAAINFATSGATTLSSDLTLSTTSGGVDIAGPIDGGFNLSINAALGTTFGGVIGGTTPLNVLEVVESGGTTTLGGNVTTTSHQYFQNPVALAANATLTGESSILDSVEGGGYSLVLDYLCGTSIGSGGIAAENLASLTVANGITSINGSIETTGAQVYSNGSVALLGTTVLQGDSLVIGKSLSAQLNDLTLNFAQTTAVDGSVFSTLGNLTSLGPVALSGQIDSVGFQNYAAAATLSADTALNATGNIDFGSLVDGARQLTIQSGGTVRLFAALGSTTPLQGLNLASAAAVEALSTIAINGTGGTAAGLRIGDGVNNVNVALPGSTISNAALSGILLAGNTTGSTIGGFTIANSGSHGIEAAGGNYTGSVFVISSVTSSGGDGFHAANATGLTAVLLRSAANAKAGIRVAGTSSNVTISNSLVGLDANGTAAQPNLGQGIVVSAATGTTLQGNTISGNGFYGVVVTGAAAGTAVMSNRIGTGTDGTTAIGNGQSGVFVLGGATGTTIEGNRISNNNGMAGIQVVDGTSNTTIGGSGPSANLLVGNGLFGITVSGNVPGTRVLGNLVSSHTTANIYLNNARNLTVGMVGSANTFDMADYGVYAGGDLTGTTIAGNTFQQHTLGGMVLTNAGNLTVRDNTLDDNGAYGIYGTGDLTGTTLQGNTISNHTVGVLVDNGANLTIGSASGTGTSDPDANVITKNTSAGVVVNGAGSQNVSILSNSIFENDFIGISLSANGNALARTPALTSASTTAVAGSITGTNGDVYRIQYFKSADEVTSSSRFAQGQELIGYQDVTIAGGTASIDEDITGSGVIVTDWITATATLLVSGLPSETSQFSFGIRVTA
ncbi:MAG: right-handed parallel beta-helix repeat-containing protein, partial [Planctomycetota bacterium]|nr:right-handed parallel beta-helix repeat-containing protein [Planctomycetota bacterium]